jgi:hypothetical protein
MGFGKDLLSKLGPEKNPQGLNRLRKKALFGGKTPENISPRLKPTLI